MTEPTCSMCRFFKRKGRDTPQFTDVDGMCRRHAPRGFTPQAMGLLFPPMNSGQWCGEHEPRQAPTPPTEATEASAMAATA